MHGMQPSVQNESAVLWLSYSWRCACLVLSEIQVKKKSLHPSFLRMNGIDLYIDRATGIICIQVKCQKYVSLIIMIGLVLFAWF